MDVTSLKKLYRTKSDSELLSVLDKEVDYTKETIEVVKEVINERGSFEEIRKNADIKLNKDAEKQELYRVADYMFKKGHDINEIKSKINCKYLTESEIDELLEESHQDYQVIKIDKKSTTKSISGGIVGGFIGSIIGGIIWGLMMIKSGQIIYIFGFVIFFISYFCTWKLSKKSMENRATLIISVLSFLAALFIGQMLLYYFGVEDYLQ